MRNSPDPPATVSPGVDPHRSRGGAEARSWSIALACSAMALWLPSLIAILLNHQVRRSWTDLWFWPGVMPGRYFIEDLYDENLAWSALVALVLWTLACRRRLALGILGALVHGSYSALYICALAAI